MSTASLMFPEDWGFYRLMGVPRENDKEHHFETSWLFNPWALGIIRGIISLYAFVTIIFSFAWRGTHGLGIDNVRSFSYFSNLTYWGVAFYFVAAALHTLLFAKTGESVLFKRLPRTFRVLHSMLYTMITIYPFLIMVVYWAFLYKGSGFSDWFDAWRNISLHAITPLFSAFEVLFSNILRPSLMHLLPLNLILIAYLVLAYVIHATQGFYTYPFLDPEKNSDGIIVAYCAAIFGAVVVMLFLVRHVTHKRIEFAAWRKWKMSQTQPILTASTLRIELAERK